RVSPTQMTKVNVTNNINVRPTRATMLGPNAGRSAAVPPQRSFGRPVVSRQASAQNPRVQFHPESPVANSARNQKIGGNAGRNQDFRQNRNAGRNNIGQNNANNTGRNQTFGQNQNLGRNQGPASEMRGAQRQAENVPSRGASPNSNIRIPESRPMASRNVPRPPSAGGVSGDRGMNSGAASGPRSNVAMPNARPESQQRPSAPEMSRGSVPHPPSAGMNRGEAPS